MLDAMPRNQVQLLSPVSAFRTIRNGRPQSVQVWVGRPSFEIVNNRPAKLSNLLEAAVGTTLGIRTLRCGARAQRTDSVPYHQENVVGELPHRTVAVWRSPVQSIVGHLTHRPLHRIQHSAQQW